MDKPQKDAIRGYAHALAAEMQANGIVSFRQYLRDQIGESPVREMTTIKALIATFDGLKGIANPRSSISYDMRCMLLDAIGGADRKAEIATHILNSSFLKTWVSNDSPDAPHDDLAGFVSIMHSHTAPMTLIGNVRKLGTAYVARDIHDDYSGSPIRSGMTVFVNHGQDGKATLSFQRAGYSRPVEVSALASAWQAQLTRALTAQHEYNQSFGRQDATIMHHAKTVRAANNVLVHAANDLREFFGKVSVVPLSPAVVEALDAAAEALKPKEGMRLRAQPHFREPWSGAL